MKADDAICQYLLEMSEKVVQKFYKVMALFFENYRICLNEFGWDIVNGYKRIKVSENEERKAFTTVKPPEYLPQVANIFIQRYLPKHMKKFDRKLAIGLTKHFCDWLVRKKYTSTALNIIEEA